MEESGPRRLQQMGHDIIMKSINADGRLDRIPISLFARYKHEPRSLPDGDVGAKLTKTEGTMPL
jgi:hypothetical protein